MNIIFQSRLRPYVNAEIRRTPIGNESPSRPPRLKRLSPGKRSFREELALAGSGMEKQIRGTGRTGLGHESRADGSRQGSDPYFQYTVQPGDNLWTLAVKKFHVNLEDIIKDNKIEDPDLIYPGQKLIIRRPSIAQAQEVTASWYGAQYHGRPMANGEAFDMYGATIAHKELPFGTTVELENPSTGEKARAVVTDRGPFIPGRDVDLSYGLAARLSMVKQGVGKLLMKVL